MNRFIFLLSTCVCCAANAQTLPVSVSYQGPILSDPIEIRYAWRSAVSADEDRIAVSYGHWSGVGEVRIFELKTGKTIGRYGTDQGVRGLAPLPGHRQFATGDFAGNLVIRNFSDGSVVSQWRSPGASIEAIAFSGDGEECFIASNGNYVARAHAKTGHIKLIYEGHADNVYDVALSPDGKKLLSSAANGVVILWNADTGQLLHKLSHPGQVAAVHWFNDSNRFASVSSDNRLCLWDADSGKLIDEVDTHQSLYSVDIDETEKTIATGGRLGIQIWDARTLEPVEPATASPFEGHQSLVFGVRFFGGDKLLTSGWDKRTFVWDRNTGSQIRQYTAASEARAPIVAIAANASLSQAVVARAGGSITRIDIDNLQTLASWSLPGDEDVAAMDVADASLVIATQDGSIFQLSLDVTDVGNLPKPRWIAKLEEKPIAINQLTADAANEIAIVTATGKIIRVDATSGAIKQTLTLDGEADAATWLSGKPAAMVLHSTGELARLEFSEDASGQWTAQKRASIRLPPQRDCRLHQISDQQIVVQFGSAGMIVDADSLQFAGQLPAGGQPRAAAVGSADGRILLSGTELGALQTYQRREVPIAPTAQTKLAFGDVRFTAFSPDASTIRVGSIHCDFTKLATGDLSAIDKVRRLPPFGMASAARSLDRQVVAVGGWSGEVLLFDPETVEIFSQLPPETVKKTGQPGAVGFSKDQKRVVVGNSDGVVRMYEVDPPKLVWQSKAFGTPINDVAISDDSKHVAASTGDYRRYQDPGLTVLLSATDGTTQHVWDDSTAKVTGVAFNPDSTKLVACGNDAFHTYDIQSKSVQHVESQMRGCQRVKFIDAVRCIVTMYPGQIVVWDTEADQAVARFTGHVKPPGEERQPIIWGIDVSDDGKQLVTGDLVGQIYLWPIP